MVSDFDQTHSRDQKEIIRLNALLDQSAGRIAELDAELTSLRALKAACEGQEVVAWVRYPRFTGSIQRQEITFECPDGNDWTELYLHPDHEAAQLRMRIAELERKYSESIGGFKRDLQEKLDQQRAKNKRLENKIGDLERELANARASSIHRGDKMKHQKGYIDIPGWFFWLAPIGAVLIVIELVRIACWLYETVEIVIK